MLPLADHNPTRLLPILTWLIIATNVVMFTGQLIGPYGLEWSVQAYGLIPARLFGAPATVPGSAAPLTTLLTSMFLHGGFLHIAGNMLYLYIFGDNIESDLGRPRFLILYLLAGLAAAGAQIATGPASPIPMVGASGAISGVLGAYILFHPRQSITVLVPNLGLTQLPAIVVLGMWFGYQLLYGLLSNPAEGGVAFFAHIGGFVAGVILAALLKPHSHPA